AAIQQLYAGWQSAAADTLQQALNDFRQLMQRYPMIPALKAVIARYTRDPDWGTVRPPLVELNSDQYQGLVSLLEARGFSMPGRCD
ncbi:MAG TPA: hypothetical protein VLB07_03755, partial [Woeseiaceae bacterium]|nr:hypothetical protein [Woeseiaceae bacterium]